MTEPERNEAHIMSMKTAIETAHEEGRKQGRLEMIAEMIEILSAMLEREPGGKS